MTAWRTIDTAPKDGTPFWGDESGDGKRMFWHDGFQEFISQYNRITMAEGYSIDGKPFKDHSPVIHHPTHWMPLPEPPETQG